MVIHLRLINNQQIYEQRDSQMILRKSLLLLQDPQLYL